MCDFLVGGMMDNDCMLMNRTQTFMSKFLKVPENPNKIATKMPKLSGRVLTSAENLRDLRAIEEKKQKKKEEQKKKKNLKQQKALLKQQDRDKKKSAGNWDLLQPSPPGTKRPLAIVAWLQWLHITKHL